MEGIVDLQIISVAESFCSILMLLQIHLTRMARRRRLRAAVVAYSMSASDASCRSMDARHRFLRQRILCPSENYSPRRWWVYPRSTNWWANFVTTIWGNEQWQENFRMTRMKFLWICDRLRDRLFRQQTILRVPITVEERVAVTLWFLANTISYRLVGQQFGLARSTVAMIVIEVCEALERELLSLVVRPGPPLEAMQGFASMGFPHCVGAMDGCHIYIRAPFVDQEAYIDRHKRHSVVLQGTVDHRGHFVDITVGNVGCDHDAHVLWCSNIFDAMDTCVWVPGNPTLTIDGVTIPALILADAAYPLRSWLMTPYGGSNLSDAKKHYNRMHNRARATVERAFGCLKSRWRAIGGILYVTEENINSVICSCVIVHNICQSATVPPDYFNLGVHHARVPYQHENPKTIDDRQQKEGEKIKKVIKNLLYQQRH